MSKSQWLNTNDYFDHRPPNTDRSTWTRSNEWSFGTSKFKGVNWPKREFNKDKCETCGGTGTIMVANGRRKTVKSCPDNCEYTVRI